MLEEGEQGSAALLEQSGGPVGCGRFVHTAAAQSRGFPVQHGAGCRPEAGLGSICLNSCTATALPLLNSCSDPSLLQAPTVGVLISHCRDQDPLGLRLRLGQGRRPCWSCAPNPAASCAPLEENHSEEDDGVSTPLPSPTPANGRASGLPSPIHGCRANGDLIVPIATLGCHLQHPVVPAPLPTDSCPSSALLT